MSYCYPVHRFPSAFQKQQFWPAPFLLFCILFAVHEALFRAIEWSWTRDNQSLMSSLEDVTVVYLPNVALTMCCCRGADVGLTDRNKTCHSSQTACIKWPCALCALAKSHSLRFVVSSDLLQ